MKKLIICLIVFGLAIQTQAQVETKVEKLSEVVIAATNYKYLTKVGLENTSVPVSLLEQKVASFDLVASDFYHDEFGSYIVSFYIPEGKILATYDNKGNIIRTAERFKDVKMPRNVIEAVAKQYPNWSLTKNLYLVQYYDSGNITKKYKITLENGDKRIKVVIDDDGTIL